MIKLTWRIWALVILLALSILSIFSFPPLFLSSGVIVKSVEVNSTVFNEGLKQGEIIKSINNQPVNNFEDYSKIIAPLNNKTNESIKLVIITNKNTYSFFNQGSLQIIVGNVPKTTLKTGLDLQGGARALVAPEKQLTNSEMQDLIAVSNERLNVYGISDVVIKKVSDLTGNNYMLVEIAGATPNDLESLIGQQGKFEAKIGNETVFVGGNKDITYVCRDDASCAGIEACNVVQGGELCNYRFVIHLSEDAAKRHADITSKLSVNSSSLTAGDRYLEKQIDFFVDDKLSTSLYISEDLKGKVTTQIQIQGSGTGADRNSAIQNAEDSMKKMQTILITGSLPYKLNIVKLDTISPVLGERFNYLILLTGLAGLVAVAIIIFARYRNFKASMALLFTSFSEVVIILGVASLIKWNLDLPSIVGILVTIGTGVDQQIVILDEFKSKRIESTREKLKNALFIVVSAFFTAVVSLIPLFWAGAGLLKGFSVTTIIGLTIGVLISRPAFADMLKFLGEKNT
ncbi:MMPL family transporter [Candidatus Pacearchaeota archaeon]|nr:MMPL family transporter [Candidatus Pacearchaeota archaeon]